LSREEAAGMSKHPEVHPVHKDVYVAAREAFVLARRQLQTYVKRLRGEVKTHHQDPRTGVRASA
jgi:hypothetical protein